MENQINNPHIKDLDENSNIGVEGTLRSGETQTKADIFKEKEIKRIGGAMKINKTHQNRMFKEQKGSFQHIKSNLK